MRNNIESDEKYSCEDKNMIKEQKLKMIINKIWDYYSSTMIYFTPCHGTSTTIDRGIATDSFKMFAPVNIGQNAKH